MSSKQFLIVVAQVIRQRSQEHGLAASLCSNHRDTNMLTSGEALP